MTQVKKTEPTHKDKLGREIKVGDFVAYPERNSLQFGRVMKLNAKMIGVLPAIQHAKWPQTKNTNKYPPDLVRLAPEEMTWYILRNTA
jgi:hypothetical protein